MVTNGVRNILRRKLCALRKLVFTKPLLGIALFHWWSFSVFSSTSSSTGEAEIVFKTFGRKHLMLDKK
jgi:hypothetical protein